MSATRLTLTGCLVLAVFVAGCGEDVAGRPSGSAAPPAATTAPASTSAVPPASSTTPTQPPPTGTSKPRPPVAGTCTVAQLRITLGAGEGTAGTFYRPLVFTNTGRRTCVIQGFPGVSFVAGEDGHQVGRPAVRNGPKGPAIRLAPRAAAAATLGFADLGAFDPAKCKPTPVRGLRVYPPHDTRAAFVPFPTKACAGNPPSPHLRVMTVQPVQD